jgi:hypothetical protein
VPGEEAERICERRRRTGWSPRRLACEPDIRRPHSTIHQVLRRGGCSCRPAPERGAVVRYQWPCPGQLLHMDVKKLARFEAPGHALTAERARRTRGAGWEYVHSIVDDRSRLAYAEIHPDERAPTVTACTRRALDWFDDLCGCPHKYRYAETCVMPRNPGIAAGVGRRRARNIGITPGWPDTDPAEYALRMPGCRWHQRASAASGSVV